MNKLRLSLLIVATIITIWSSVMLAIATPLCQEQTDQDDIPCLGLTKVLSCSGNLSVTNINSSQVTNISTYAQTDGTYNFTFNFNRSSYSLKACDNSTATMVVGDFEGDRLWKSAVILGFIGICILFGLIGRFTFDANLWIVKSFLYVSAISVALIAVQAGFIISNPVVENIGRIMTISLTLTLVSIGFLILYMFLFATISIFRALKEVKKEKSQL